MAAEVNMEGIIDHLSGVLSRRFANDISRIYFGDIGMYLPSAFGGSRQNPMAVVALQPSYNHPIEGQRVAAFENRLLGLHIIVMINITPYFEANPQEAFGERKLVRLTTQIADYLSQLELESLGDRVQYTRVGAIDWAWVAKGDQAIRAAGIAYEARVRIPRI
jgi:hypothetical protein